MALKKKTTTAAALGDELVLKFKTEQEVASYFTNWSPDQMG